MIEGAFFAGKGAFFLVFVVAFLFDGLFGVFGVLGAMEVGVGGYLFVDEAVDEIGLLGGGGGFGLLVVVVY